MNHEEELKQRLARLTQWSDRYQKIFDKTLKDASESYLQTLRFWEEEKKSKAEQFRQEEQQLRSQFEAAGKEYAKKKYVLERDSIQNKNEITAIDEDIERNKNQLEVQLAQLNETKVKALASYEKQKSALTDLYREKRRHLIETRGRLLREEQKASENLKAGKAKANKELDDQKTAHDKQLEEMREQFKAKQEGWALALESLRKQVDHLTEERDDIKKRLTTIRDESENQLESARASMRLAKEQLEVDKVTLIEQADADQKKCEKEVQDLQESILSQEKELQDCVVNKEQQTKNEEELFEREEAALKETVRNESEKRDYEQKLFEQEKLQKEKELNRLKEEYDKKKWYWDNQVRNLMMQKSVQASEFEAEKMRVDREARVTLRALDAKRDELRQRLSEIKSRFNHLKSQEDKERELRNQRFRWRKDRLWSMWQSRLETLKKERLALQEQLQGLEDLFSKERERMLTREQIETRRVHELDRTIAEQGSKSQGEKKGKEVQFELEKTRLLAQIKECEALIGDWTDRLKESQNELDHHKKGFGDQLSFLERLYQEEQKETELFLYSLRKTLSALEATMNYPDVKKRRREDGQTRR